MNKINTYCFLCKTNVKTLPHLILSSLDKNNIIDNNICQKCFYILPIDIQKQLYNIVPDKNITLSSKILNALKKSNRHTFYKPWCVYTEDQFIFYDNIRKCIKNIINLQSSHKLIYGVYKDGIKINDLIIEQEIKKYIQQCKNKNMFTGV